MLVSYFDLIECNLHKKQNKTKKQCLKETLAASFFSEETEIQRHQVFCPPDINGMAASEAMFAALQIWYPYIFLKHGSFLK